MEASGPNVTGILTLIAVPEIIAETAYSWEMRVEWLGERAVILRDLPCEPWRLAKALNSDSRFLLKLGFEEAVASYETLGLYFSKASVNLAGVEEAVGQILGDLDSGLDHGKTVEIPVCYELGPDLQAASLALGVEAEALIQAHAQGQYLCYAVGFSPGFAYLGYLPETICGLPRLISPRVRVEPGSVGITGRQTAVYPSATPGGWNLIGRCPLELVNVADGYFPIEAGNVVRFTRIDATEFAKLEGERL